MAEDEIKQQQRGIALKIRIAQAISAGIFTFGLSAISGDVTGTMGWPVSPFSITTTLFGAMGMLICEIFARRFE